MNQPFPRSTRAIRLPRFPACCRALLVVCFTVACGEGTTLVTPPPSDTTTNEDDDDGVVQKAYLHISVAPDSVDAEVALALGWADFIPGAEVTIARAYSAEGEQTDTADSAGTVEFANLLPGSYSVSVFRRLTPEEAARLPGHSADVMAFGGASVVKVTAPGIAESVSAVAGRPGTLVFSEFFGPVPRTPAGNSYYWGHYLEIANNSNHVINIGGKVIGFGISWLHDYDSYTCERMGEWRLDPEGIWTGYRYKFPGSRPLSPGEAVVIATDALDHSQFVAGLPNLSRADFEFTGSGDTDNPSVPNMINMGPREWGLEKRGQYLPLGSHVIVLADEVNEDDLPVDSLPVVDPEFRRIPREKILDVFSSEPVPTYTPLAPPCDRFTAEHFDRGRANLVDPTQLTSIKRRIFSQRPDGSVILQNTRTSARDYERDYGTPGTLP